MPTKSVKAAKTRTRAEVTLAHRLHSLLHTVRLIVQSEDELCTLLHAVEHGDKDTAELRADLQRVLSSLPGHEYAHELDAVLSAANLPESKPKRASKAAKAVRGRSIKSAAKLPAPARSKRKLPAKRK